jgi:RHS repeat-associated protein
MTAQLLKNGASFTVASEKSYDAWGGIRARNSNPEYQGIYCANLGHTQNDEASLIYMRARYYEPSSGRFVSEDVASDGQNWYIYCGNCPVNANDSSGCNMAAVLNELRFAVGALIGNIMGYYLMTLLIQQNMNPKFKGDHVILAVGSGKATAAISIGCSIGISPDKGFLHKGLSYFAKTAARSLAQTALVSLRIATGVGLFIGLLFGALASPIDHLYSEEFADSYQESPWFGAF